MKISLLPLLILGSFLFPGNDLIAQRLDDTITINNGNIMIGKIRWMETNRLRIDASYGHGEWEVKWASVIGVNTINKFQVGLSNGNTYYGRLVTLPGPDLRIITDNLDSISCAFPDIIAIRPINDRFIEKLDASISLGLNLAKARNLVSFTTRSRIGYKTKTSTLDLSYDDLRSKQDETDPIRRTESAFNFNLIFPKQYYGKALISGLSNTEQNLDLRLNVNASVGKYLISKQSFYWGVLLGANHNFEQFSSEMSNRNSWEGLIQTELDIFNLGDLKLKTSAVAYPSITEAGRWRADFKFDIQYDIKYLRISGLKNKIFLKLGFSANYDNQPASNAASFDYVLNTTLGFSWNE